MPIMASAPKAVNQKAIHVLAKNITLVPAVRTVSLSYYIEFRHTCRLAGFLFHFDYSKSEQ